MASLKRLQLSLPVRILRQFFSVILFLEHTLKKKKAKHIPNIHIRSQTTYKKPKPKVESGGENKVDSNFSNLYFKYN